MLGYPKVLVCDAWASGLQPSLTAEASGHSQRRFSVYVCSCVLVSVCVCVSECEGMYVCHCVSIYQGPKQHEMACVQWLCFLCVYICVYICVCT